MECNKDEAARAKGIAENKFAERDIARAKKFALKAYNLFPMLDGLSQFLDIINVYAAHGNRINGEIDCYGILGVDPCAEEELIRKQYKRLALSIHPDKNKSVGADGAFNILSEAWNVLSDKGKRIAYDMKLNLRAPNRSSSQPCSSSLHNHRNTASGAHFQYPSSHQWAPEAAAAFVSGYDPASCHPGSSPFGMRTATADSQYYPQQPHQQSSSRVRPLFPRQQQTPPPASAPQFVPAARPTLWSRYTASRSQSTSSFCPSRPETFWACCSRCSIHYEYKKIYLNENLLCSRCQQLFLATPSPPNANWHTSFPSPIPRQPQDPAASSGGPRSMPSLASRTSGAVPGQPSSAHAKRRGEMAVNMGTDSERLMKNSFTVPENVGTASAPCTDSGHLSRKKPVKRCKDGQRCDGSRSQKKAGPPGAKRASENVKGSSGEGEQSWRVKEFSQVELHAMLMRKAKEEILSHLNHCESERSDSSKLKRVDKRDSPVASVNDPVNHPRAEKSADGMNSDPYSRSQPQNSPTLKENDSDPSEEFVSMVVPEANFHNFDDDRVEDSFTPGQVWAAYDDDDGMPRYYAMVHQVISTCPFKILISWLNSKSSSEFGPLEWIASGFTKTSGDFRIGKFVMSKRLNSFSHRVKWIKGARGVIQVFPRKGDVWALYRNWSADWDETTADGTIHKYDLVVVLDECTEDKGVLVSRLSKLAGFTSVFNLILGHGESRTIPGEEMFRFSHQVPFYMLNGQEAVHAPKDCYELDPAALPLDLLREEFPDNQCM